MSLQSKIPGFNDCITRFIPYEYSKSYFPIGRIPHLLRNKKATGTKRLLVVLDESLPKGIVENREVIWDKGVAQEAEVIDMPTVFGDGRLQEVWSNMLDYAAKDADVDVPKEIVFIQYFPFISRRKDNLMSYTDRHAVAEKVVIEAIERFQVDAVILLGYPCMEFMRPYLDGLRDIQPYHLHNRVFYYDTETRGRIPIVGTAPQFLKSILPGSSGKNAGVDEAMLIGEMTQGLTNVLRRKNLYKVDLSKYKSHLIKTIEEFDDFYDDLIEADVVSIDTETKNLLRFDNMITLLQMTIDGVNAYNIPFAHKETPFLSDEIKYMSNKLRIYFERGESKYHIYTNAKFDIMRFKVDFGVRWYNHRIYDIQAGQYLLDENRKFREKIRIPCKKEEKLGNYALATLAIEYGTFFYNNPKNMSKREREDTFNTPLERLSNYGGADVVIPWQICQFQQQEAKRRGPAYKKFLRLVTHQCSSMITAFINMEHTGLLVDKAYLFKEASSDGRFVKELAKYKKNLEQSAEAQQANKILGKIHGDVGGSLYGGNLNRFNIDENLSKQVLFFDILGLEPLDGGGKNFRKKLVVGRDGREYVKKVPAYSIGKAFNKKYNTIPIVEEYFQYEEYKKLYGTFIKGFALMLTKGDPAFDGRIRSDFMYLSVITGRSAAKKPSLQQLPARNEELAAIVNRQFVADKGCLFVKSDYAAHEVRNWGIIAGDDAIASTFIKAMEAKLEFRLLKKVAEADLQEGGKWHTLFKELDSHIQNACRFFNMHVKDVTKQIRSNVKNVVFGTIYGKAARSLARELGISDEECASLIDAMFTAWPLGKRMIDEHVKSGRDTYTIISAIGRVRHLWGYAHYANAIKNAMDRRGPNSSIQGMSSDEGFEGCYQLNKLVWDLFISQNMPLFLKSANAVHDSTENLSGAHTVPIALYLTEHAYTTQVHRMYARTYGVNFNCGLEMDFDIGPSRGVMHSWNKRFDQVIPLIEQSLEWQNENLGYKLDIDAILDKAEHNNAIIKKIREQELRELTPENFVTTELLMNRHNVKDFGFIL